MGTIEIRPRLRGGMDRFLIKQEEKKETTIEEKDVKK